MILFLALLFIGTVYGICPTTKDNLLVCIKKLLDTDNNDEVTKEEIEGFLKTNTCLPPRYKHMLTGEQIVTICDTDNDKVLTIKDWDKPNSCLQKEEHQLYICRLCDMCVKEK